MDIVHNGFSVFSSSLKKIFAGVNPSNSVIGSRGIVGTFADLKVDPESVPASLAFSPIEPFGGYFSIHTFSPLSSSTEIQTPVNSCLKLGAYQEHTGQQSRHRLSSQEKVPPWSTWRPLDRHKTRSQFLRNRRSP